MEDSIYEYVLANLRESKGQWSAVAEGSGVPKRTLEKIARMEIRNPGVSQIQKLANYFRNQSVA